MKVKLVVAALLALLPLSACDDSPPPPPTAAPAAIDSASALQARTIARVPVPTDIQGIALSGGHAAYVVGESRLVLLDWRTGDRRTVYRTTYGSLFLLRIAGRQAYVLDQRPSPAGDDPAAPRRTVRVDLRSGRTSAARLPAHEVPVGSLNDLALVVARPDRDRTDPWWGNLVGRWQQPGTHRRDRHLTRNGLVVEAATYDHWVAWTQRPDHRSGDPDRVVAVDLFHPRHRPVVLSHTGHVPYAPVAGAGFVGWAEDGSRLRLVAPTGGPVTRVPGELAAATSPAASGHLVGVVLAGHGRSELTVLRVAPDSRTAG